MLSSRMGFLGGNVYPEKLFPPMVLYETMGSSLRDLPQGH